MAIVDLVRRHRLTLLLGATAGLLVLCGSLFWTHALLVARVAWAGEQTEIFDQLRKEALQQDAADAAQRLNYIVSYYPSGTKQEPGSHLDRLVERDRAIAVRDIVAYLRVKTGENLGDHPGPWIGKYGRK